MAILLVTYDLMKKPNSAGYAGLHAVIKSSRNWAKLSESSYALETSLSPRALYDQLKMHLDGNDSLLVFTLTGQYFGQHSQEVVNWLAQKM